MIFILTSGFFYEKGGTKRHILIGHQLRSNQNKKSSSKLVKLFRRSRCSVLYFGMISVSAIFVLIVRIRILKLSYVHVHVGRCSCAVIADGGGSHPKAQNGTPTSPEQFHELGGPSVILIASQLMPY